MRDRNDLISRPSTAFTNRHSDPEVVETMDLEPFTTSAQGSIVDSTGESVADVEDVVEPEPMEDSSTDLEE